MPKVQSAQMQESTLAFDTAVKITIAESSAATSCANIDSSFQGGARKLYISCLRSGVSRCRETAKCVGAVEVRQCCSCDTTLSYIDNCPHLVYRHIIRTIVGSRQSCFTNAEVSDIYKSDAMQLSRGEPQI